MNGLGRQIRKRWIAATCGAVATVLVGVGLYFTEPGNFFISLSYDLPFAVRRQAIPDGVVIVYLDEMSHRVMEQPLNAPWDRTKHAELLRRLRDGGAKCVVFDILFTDPDKEAPERDSKLRDAIRAHGNVVLGGDCPVVGPSTLIDRPIPMLREVATEWGLVNFVERDFTVREHLGVTADEQSLPWAAAKAIAAPVTKTSTQSAAHRWVNYYGPPGALSSVSYHRAFFADSLPTNFFRGKTVFIGARQSTSYSGSGKDEFNTAFTWATHTLSPGVEIHATMFLNLLRQDWLTRVPSPLEVASILIIGFVAGFGLSLLRSVHATIGALVIAIGITLCAWLLFRYGLVWFAWLILVVQVICALLWSVIYNSIQSYIERSVLERSLALHLPARRVKQILRQPELLAPSAEKQEVSLLFTDITDFSTISDRVTPDRLFKLLNGYFEQTIPCIHEAEGMVLSLIGDAIFAMWNAPEPQPNHQELACRAALSLRDKLVQFESSNTSYPLRTRVGLHCGLASVGNCGSADRFVYTALGAEPNMASRLEGLNKYLGTEILASDRIAEAVEEKFTWRNVGRFRLKGADRVFDVCELVDDAKAREATASWRELFATGLRAFHSARFDEAEAVFTQVLAIKPNDGPAKFYLEEIPHARSRLPGEKWFGEINMEAK